MKIMLNDFIYLLFITLVCWASSYLFNGDKIKLANLTFFSLLTMYVLFFNTVYYVMKCIAFNILSG